MKNKLLIAAIGAFLFIICAPVYSQDFSEEILIEGDSHDENSIFVINSFSFVINGYTRRYALINKAELIEGEEINGFTNLEKYIQNKTQILYNERVLDSVRIEYSISPAREDGKYPVNLFIYVKDTWNIVAIPRPQLDSNTGFDITIKARDYNFLGTMSALRVDLGYRHDEKGRDFFEFMFDSDIPVRIFNLNWYINFDHDVSYRPDMEQNWFYCNATGLSVDIPFGFTTPNIGFDIYFIVNEDNSDMDRELYELGESQEGLYISTRPYISWKIPITKIGDYGELAYTPRISAIFNHEVSPWTLSINRKGPFLGFSHALGFGRINWIDNFQQGFTANVYNSFNYDFFKYRNDEYPLSTRLEAKGAAHFKFFNFLGLSTRLMYRQWFNTYTESAGDVLRGIIDKDITTDLMVSLNMDLIFKVLRFKPSQWFNWNTRLFDFDLHIGPIVDLAYSNTISELSELDKNIFITGGFEVIIYPIFFRSLYLRISTAWDFSDISKRTPMELFIGTTLHF